MTTGQGLARAPPAADHLLMGCLNRIFACRTVRSRWRLLAPIVLVSACATVATVGQTGLNAVPDDGFCDQTLTKIDCYAEPVAGQLILIEDAFDKYNEIEQLFTKGPWGHNQNTDLVHNALLLGDGQVTFTHPLRQSSKNALAIMTEAFKEGDIVSLRGVFMIPRGGNGA